LVIALFGQRIFLGFFVVHKVYSVVEVWELAESSGTFATDLFLVMRPDLLQATRRNGVNYTATPF